MSGNKWDFSEARKVALGKKTYSKISCNEIVKLKVNVE